MKIGDKKMEDYRNKMIACEDEIKKSIIGIDDIIRLVVTAVFSRGHILFDGLPGLAKTTLCFAVSRALGGAMVKFDGRPDFTPSQFLYVTEPDEEGNPKFYKGPLITKANVLTVTLLDEITRFVSQAQAFWFEIMNEFRLTLPTQEIDLSHNRVFATKNKVTRGETFEIPQPQLDRFMVNIELSYPDEKSEKEIISNSEFDDPGKLVRRVNSVFENLSDLEEAVEGIQASVQMSPEMKNYLFNVILATRFPSRFGVKLEGITDIDSLVDNRFNASGISPRGGAKWRRLAKIVALRRGADYVTPKDAIGIAYETLCHRIFVNQRAAGDRNRAMLARDFLGAVLSKIEAPGNG